MVARVVTIRAVGDRVGQALDYYAGLAADQLDREGTAHGPVDYYLDPNEPPGRWWGTGCPALGLYKRHVDCWMGKILQAFPSAAIVDAFAGPGRYSDGPDGSPLVIAKAYLNHSGRERLRTLRIICNEGRADRNEALARRLAALPTDARLEASVIAPASTFRCGRVDPRATGSSPRGSAADALASRSI